MNNKMSYKNNLSLLGVGIVLLLTIVIVLILAVYFFTRPVIVSFLGLSNMGQIGDAIGGITAPIIGIIGSLLVYLSFYQQYIANKIQRIAIAEEVNRAQSNKEFSILLDLFNNIKDDLDRLSFSSEYSKEHGESHGRNSIHAFKTALYHWGNREGFKQNGFFKDYIHFLGLFKFYFEKNRTCMVDIEDKKLVLTLVVHLYQTKIAPYNAEIIKICEHGNIMLEFKNAIMEVDKKVIEVSQEL